MKKPFRARKTLLFRKRSATPDFRVQSIPSRDTFSLRSLLLLTVFVFLLSGTPNLASPGGDVFPDALPVDDFGVAADPGTPIEMGDYMVLEANGGEITSRGGVLCAILESHGIVCSLETTVSLDPQDLAGAQAVILDGSCGSNSGTLLSNDTLSMLETSGLPLVLLGRAAWLVHRLRDTGPPSLTAPLETTLQQHPDYSGAVFLQYPVGITPGSSLTSETGLSLPVDVIQTSHSRLVNLTAASIPSLSPLRYVSVSNDVFLFGPEDAALLTVAGEDLLVNTIAYATALGESEIASTIASRQSDGALAGGFTHSHNPSMQAAYDTVHSIHSLKSSSDFETWRSANSELVDLTLSDLLVDFGSESGFRSSPFGSETVTATAQGLWLVDVMNLESFYDTNEIVSFLVDHQSGDGGFSDSLSVTFHVVEALESTGNLGAIDIADLETWLRACVITGSDTSDSNQWGGVGSHPTDGTAKNSNAARYIQSLWLLGQAHTDPLKLTEWIQSTANGDGSFTDSVGPDQQVTLGTASALTTMAVLGTLDIGNKTAALSWYNTNQLSSGSFGIGLADDDIIAKTSMASAVASSLEQMEETTGQVVTGLLEYCSSITTETGFEPMEMVSSLMWTYWLTRSSILSHSSTVSLRDVQDYLDLFVGYGFSVYPGWGNVTKASPPEYAYQQYYDKGVWAHYFGLATAGLVGWEVPTGLESDITLYLALAQTAGGHFKPSSSGSAHMQYSAAAVEALHLLDELDTMWYRSALENAILTRYAGGQWSTSGWSLQPFADCQSAIDFLSTRAALRLGLISPAMANEIQNAISARVQYEDLISLSWDVESLMLLREAGFDADLSAVSESIILTKLSSAFSEGWFNLTELWQPIYTAQALELASVFGLRARMLQIVGDSIALSVPSSVFSGNNLSISVAIGSVTSGHRVLVRAFNTWTEFTNVQAIDTLDISVPSDEEFLGVQDVFIMLHDEGASRAFDTSTTTVLTWTDSELQLRGVTPDALLGDTHAISAQLVDESENPISGQPVTLTVTYLPSTVVLQETLTTNATGHVSVVWTPTNPGEYSIEGDYDGSTGIGASYDSLMTFVRIETSVSAEMAPFLEVGVPSWIMVTASGVDSQPIDAQVEVTVRDPSDQIVFQEVVSTSSGIANISWTPSVRGLSNTTVLLPRQGWFEESMVMHSQGVYEKPCVQVEFLDDPVAPTTASLRVTVSDNAAIPLDGVSVNVSLWIEGTLIQKTTMSTGADGTLTVDLSMTNPGEMQIGVTALAEGWLLESPYGQNETILGLSTIAISTPGTPIEQATTLGITVSLRDWTDTPMVGASVTISIAWANGTIIESATVFTGSGGTCSVGHEFAHVGDFWIAADYEGTGLNSSASSSRVQRVRVTPDLHISHEPSCLVGIDTVFIVDLTDAYGDSVPGRALILSLEMGNTTVYQVSFTSGMSAVAIHWTPGTRGLVFVILTHDGNEFFLANTTSGSLSSMALIDGDLELDVEEIDLFSSAIVTYTLTSPLEGIEVAVQVLGMDLVPVWTTSGLTDAAGVVTVTYSAIHCHGMLRVVGAPAEDQFLLGGDAQVSLKVWTDANISTGMEPSPPTTGTEIVVTVQIQDELGFSIDGLRIAISVYDIYYSRLFTTYEDTLDGLAQLTFVPSQWGVYRVEVSSSGSETVHSFSTDPDDHMHTVYCPTQVTLLVDSTEIEVGSTVTITALLTNVLDNPLAGMTLNLSIEGDDLFGPVTKVTDGTGTVTWTVTLDEQGFWEMRAEFFGLGTYLPTLETLDLHSCYGTSILLVMNNETEVIAGVTPLNVSVLLVDSAMNPLEGRTIHWEFYNDEVGLIDSGSFVQLGVEPEIFVLDVVRGGNTTFVFSFLGSDHYHSSNSAVDILVLGTSEIIYAGPHQIDRANESLLEIRVLDEMGLPCPFDSLTWSLNMTGPTGDTNLTGRAIAADSVLQIVALGLPVGDYQLTLAVSNTSTMVGCTLTLAISVVSATSVEILEQSLSGILGDQHTVILGLVDSLNDSLDELTLLVSLYHPDGREIYGSLGTTTPIILDEGSIEVSWVPTATGNYSLIIRFEGDDWLLASVLEKDVLTRRGTVIEVVSEEAIEYPSKGEVTVTLESGLTSLSGVEVTLHIVDSGLENLVSVTDSRGEVSFELPFLLAGRYNLSLMFNGTDTFAPVESNLQLSVLPKIIVSAVPESTLYAGIDGSVQVSVQALGLGEQWNGTIEIRIVNAIDEIMVNQSWFTGPEFTGQVGFLPATHGNHQLNLTLTNLPVLGVYSESLMLVVGVAPVHLTLDVATTPVAAAVPIVGIVGLILKRKFGIDLPAEWAGS